MYMCVCVRWLYSACKLLVISTFQGQAVSKNCPAMASVTFGDGLMAIQAWANFKG